MTQSTATKKLLTALGAFLILLVLSATTVEAKTTNMYTTKTVQLKEAARTKSKTLAKAKAKTRLTVIRQGKTWAKIRYKNWVVYAKKKELHKIKAVKKYTGRQLQRGGVIKWKGIRFTWYSQRSMPGSGLRILGRHVDKQGFVCDKDGYIVVGSSIANKRKRVIVPTPFGKFGKTYDCGYVGSKHFDCYVNW